MKMPISRFIKPAAGKLTQAKSMVPGERMRVPDLIRHDLLMLWRGCQSLLHSVSDTVVALFVFPFLSLMGIVFLQNSLEKLLEMPAVVTAFAGFAVFNATGSAIEARLAWHRDNSVMASKAFQSSTLFYQIIFFLPAMSLLLWVSIYFISQRAFINFFCFVIGCCIGVLLKRMLPWVANMIGGVKWGSYRISGRKCINPVYSSHRMRILHQVINDATFNTITPIPFALLITFIGLLIGAIYGTMAISNMTGASSVAVLAILSLPVIFRIFVQQHSLFPFLRVVGQHPLRIAASQIMLMTIFITSLCASAFYFSDMQYEILLLGVFFYIAFSWLVSFRAYHMATKSRTAASIALQLDFAALLIVGWIFLPALAFLVAYRAYALEASFRLKMWVMD